MLDSTRRCYLDAMQIKLWQSRINLPFAAPSNNKLTIKTPHLVSNDETITITNPDPTPEIIQQDSAISTSITAPQIIEKNLASQTSLHFSLQLMQAGNCLILVELATGEAFQIRDPAYQLLCNMLKAASLPDSPQWLGGIIHWPLFKQISIAQGAKEANEFLQSFITTYQEQLPQCNCLWLIGLPAITFTTGLDEKSYYQTPIIETLGQTLLSPSLELLIEEPQRKAPLWQSICNLMQLWTK